MYFFSDLSRISFNITSSNSQKKRKNKERESKRVLERFLFHLIGGLVYFDLLEPLKPEYKIIKSNQTHKNNTNDQLEKSEIISNAYYCIIDYALKESKQETNEFQDFNLPAENSQFVITQFRVIYIIWQMIIINL